MAHKSHTDGPVQQRSCTDVICCIIFLIITIALIGIGIYSFTGKNFGKMLIPYDADNQGCGSDAAVAQYPYIYFASPHSDSLWVTVCVSSCPKASDTQLACKTNSVVTSCAANKGADNTKNVQIYDTKALQSVCLPTDSTILQAVQGAISVSAFQDIISSWKIILASIGIAIVVCFIFMLLMRFCAKIIIWILIIFTVLCLIALGAVFLVPTKYLPSQVQEQAAKAYTANKTANIIIGVVIILIGVLFLIMAICLRKKINLAASITEVAAKFVSSQVFLFLLPIGLFLAMLIFLVIWVFFCVGFYSLGKPKNQPKSLPFQHFETPTSVFVLLVVHLIYLLWGLIFFVQTGSFLVTGAAVGFYYQKTSPFKQSSDRYRKFHSPSVVKGALLWLLIGWLKLIFDILTPDSDSGILGGIRKVCETIWCCCVKTIFKCIDKGAHTIIHLQGIGYCSAAQNAITLKESELQTSAVVETTTSIFAWLSRFSIAAITALISYVILTRVSPYKQTISQAYLPTIIILCIGLAIGSFFVSLYSDASDAIYYCYLARGKDSTAPQELKDFIKQSKIRD